MVIPITRITTLATRRRQESRASASAAAGTEASRSSSPDGARSSTAPGRGVSPGTSCRSRKDAGATGVGMVKSPAANACPAGAGATTCSAAIEPTRRSPALTIGWT
jgi:hypothetical protein